MCIVVIFFNVNLHAEENPFNTMSHKKYADYSQELIGLYTLFFQIDTIEAEKMLIQVEEVAQKIGTIEWKLISEYFKLLMFDKKRSLYGNELFSVDDLLKNTLELLHIAQKHQVTHLELTIRQKIIDYYWVYFNNYESAFELYAVQDDRLQEISAELIPEKSYYYRMIADAYYTFKDYQRAILYFNKVLEDKNSNLHNIYSRQHALNGKGLSFRNGYQDYDRSDSCFHEIINVAEMFPENELFYDRWLGIANGNIGHNMLQRNEYENAIPLLKSSIEKMLKHADYAYASGPAINLSEIYLKMENLIEAKKYLDAATEYYNIMPREGRLPRIYEVKSKYYAAIGNIKLSLAYIDSTILANKLYEEQFNAMLLLRMEQKESAQQQQKLQQETKLRKQTQIYLIILLSGFIVILVLLVSVSFLYRRKRSAYRELVRKSQQWAQVETNNNDSIPLIVDTNTIDSAVNEQDLHKTNPDETDCLIMKEIEQLMSTEKPYRDAILSVDLLAQKLGAKRHYVSNAINHCLQKSFNTYVNEYRIKESIQILSKKDAYKFTIDEIAFDSGFNDRQNFYRVFKKMTGLSPAEFRKNVKIDS